MALWDAMSFREHLLVKEREGSLKMRTEEVNCEGDGDYDILLKK